jgi:hypothetical protein
VTSTIVAQGQVENEEWALERLRSIQKLLSTAQSLQEHTKSTRTAQVLSSKSLEII